MKLKWKAWILAACVALESTPVYATGLNDIDKITVVSESSEAGETTEITEESESSEVGETTESTEESESSEAGETTESAEESESSEAGETTESAEESESSEAIEETDSVEFDTNVDADIEEEQASEQPAEQPSEQPAEQPSEQPAEQPSEQPSEQPAEQPAKQIYEDTMDLSDWMIREGGFPDRDFVIDDSGEEIDILGADVATEAAYKAEVLRALSNREPCIDVERFYIEKNRGGRIYLDVCNEYPELFYVGPRTQYTHDGTYIKYLYPTYVYNEAQVVQVEAKAWQIVSVMGADWSIERKLMYLHDYIVMNCRYDHSYSRYDLYNVLIEKTAVCQGYAEAFVYLAKKAGIQLELVTSQDIDHAWNMININGKYYFIDSTWDDMDDENGKYGNYEFFLKSDGAFNHNGCDWYCTRIGNVNGIAAASTEYDYYFWANCYVPVPYVQNTAAFLKDNEEDGIYLHYGNGAEEKIAFPKALAWPMWNGGGNWQGIYTHVVSVGDYFCFHSADAVYGLDASGTIWLIYSLSDAERSKGYIYDLQNSTSNSVIYKLAHGPSTTFTLTKEISQDILQESRNALVIDEKAFPDAAFREIVKSFDTNHSGKFCQLEMDAVTWIDCSDAKTGGSSITSLKGIENFKNITGLNCSGQNLTSLDVSAFQNLETLACNNNSLKSLTIAKNKKLKKIYCQNNNLSALDLGNNTEIRVLSCQDNRITSLNIEKYKNLKKALLMGKKADIMSNGSNVTGYTYNLVEKDGSSTLSHDSTVKVKYGTRFLDVASNQWYVKAVDYAFDQGIMSGTGDLLFAPEASLTREQFVTVIYNHAKRPEVKSMAPFRDIKATDWYCDPISWAYTFSITSGVGNNRFGVGQSITREQLVTMLFSYVQFCDYDWSYYDKATAGFADVKEVSEWAEASMKWAVDAGVISGKPSKDGKKMYLDPKGKATRAECAQMMKNLVEAYGTK